MKRLPLIAMAVGTILSVSSCQNNAHQVEPMQQPVDTSGVDTSYIVSGLRDIKMTNVGVADINVMVNRTSGAEQKVTLSVDGMPDNSEVMIDGKTGYTSFSSAISFVTKFAPVGTYPLSVKAKSESGEMKTYNINLIITRTTTQDCHTFFLGGASINLTTYEGTSNTIVYDQSTILVNSSNERLYISRLVVEKDTTNQDIYVESTIQGTTLTFSCDDGSIKIPLQKVEGLNVNSPSMTREYYVEGAGTVDLDAEMFNITYTALTQVGGVMVPQTFSIRAPFRIQ